MIFNTFMWYFVHLARIVYFFRYQRESYLLFVPQSTDIMPLSKTVLTKTMVGFTTEQFIVIQNTFVRESAAISQRMQKDFKKRNTWSKKPLPRQNEQSYYYSNWGEINWRRRTMSLEVHWTALGECAKQFEFEEVGILIIQSGTWVIYGGHSRSQMAANLWGHGGHCSVILAVQGTNPPN